MTNHRFTKQIGEKFYIEADFSDNIASTETVVIGNSSVTATDALGVNVSFGQPNAVLTDTLAVSASGDGLIVRVTAGAEATSPYKITFLMETSLGNVWELDVQMTIAQI